MAGQNPTYCIANGGDGQWGRRCTAGVGAAAGTTAAPVIGEGWGPETPAAIQRNFHLWKPYTRSTFNVFRLGVLEARGVFMGSEGGGVKPWLSPKSVSSLQGSDHWQELVFHLALTGANDFYLSSSSDHISMEDKEVLSAVLAELSAVAGCGDRFWVPDVTSIRFGDGFVLSGMDVGQ